MVNPISHTIISKKRLYLIPTPIGNLADITLRAIELLKNSDFILCEDTRVSKKLLDKLKIKTKLISYHKFNEVKNLNKIIDLLKDNGVSLISDAGTQSISDPGAILINEKCLQYNINVIPLPGPSAVTTAVSISGFAYRKRRNIYSMVFPEKEKRRLKKS